MPRTEIPREHQEKHLWHFQVEAGVEMKNTAEEEAASKHPGNNYAFYNPSYDPRIFHNEFLVGARANIHGVFDFKPYFARPRPYQTAQIFGLDHFITHIGKAGEHTGTHPSIISGHCIQGILLSCKVLEIWLNHSEPDLTHMETLAQFAVDFGDRRVFAGVHYPTDNIASWVAAIRLIPRIFRHEERILKFARNAIIGKSLVYRTIQRTFDKDKDLLHSLELLNTYLPSTSSRSMIRFGIGSEENSASSTHGSPVFSEVRKNS